MLFRAFHPQGLDHQTMQNHPQPLKVTENHLHKNMMYYNRYNTNSYNNINIYNYNNINIYNYNNINNCHNNSYHNNNWNIIRYPYRRLASLKSMKTKSMFRIQLHMGWAVC